MAIEGLQVRIKGFRVGGRELLLPDGVELVVSPRGVAIEATEEAAVRVADMFSAARAALVDVVAGEWSCGCPPSADGHVATCRRG